MFELDKFNALMRNKISFVISASKTEFFDIIRNTFGRMTAFSDLPAVTMQAYTDIYIYLTGKGTGVLRNALAPEMIGDFVARHNAGRGIVGMFGHLTTIESIITGMASEMARKLADFFTQQFRSILIQNLHWGGAVSLTFSPINTIITAIGRESSRTVLMWMASHSRLIFASMLLEAGVWSLLYNGGFMGFIGGTFYDLLGGDVSTNPFIK